MGIQTKFTEQTGVGESVGILIKDTTDIKISYMCVVTGTVNYTVQHSLDGITYIDNSDNAAQTTNQDGNYVFPVHKVRVKVNSGDGSVKMTIRQLVV